MSKTIFNNPAVQKWWNSQPDVTASGTAYKGWITRFPGGTRDDRATAHEAVMESIVPHYPGAQDLSAICILREGRR